MAYSTDNVIIYGAHGTFAKQLVIRQRFGRSILCKRPRKSTQPPSEAQLAVRERFVAATQYAKLVMANPDLQVTYQAAAKNGLTVYNLAIADLLHAPEVQEVDASAYTGAAGSTIRVRAIDDFKVNAVQVSILSAANELLEQGAAVPSSNGMDWTYTAATDNPVTAGCTIKVQASDLPGNAAVKEQVL